MELRRQVGLRAEPGGIRDRGAGMAGHLNELDISTSVVRRGGLHPLLSLGREDLSTGDHLSSSLGLEIYGACGLLCAVVPASGTPSALFHEAVRGAGGV